MSVFAKSTSMPCSPEELFAWHVRPGAFARLVPPWERIEIVGGHPGVENGSRARLRMRQGPFSITWVAEHRDVEPGRGFVDEQIKGPFARWVHRHRFLSAGTSGRLPGTADGPGSEKSVLEDHIDYALPFGVLGRSLGESRVRAQLERTFAFRHHRTREDLQRHRPYRAEPRLRVAVTGASGLVGSALAPFLTTGGHEVLPLVRRATGPDENAVAWDPVAGVLDASRLVNVDAVVHLAGANVAAGRWTAARKEEIRRSRVDSTGLLARKLARLPRRPRVLVVASGVGYYGPRSDLVDENAPRGWGFLSDVAEAVEAAARPATDAGIRVVVLRIGVVLSRRGGFLSRLAPFFRGGAGAVLGPGTQPLSWIALDDLVGVIHQALFDAALEGPINAVAPEPVSQAKFARVLGRALGRPVRFRVPAAALRAALGEMAESVVVEGVGVRPGRLADTGFVHLHPDLEATLRTEFGRPAATDSWRGASS